MAFATKLGISSRQVRITKIASSTERRVTELLGTAARSLAEGLDVAIEVTGLSDATEVTAATSTAASPSVLAEGLRGLAKAAATPPSDVEELQTVMEGKIDPAVLDGAVATIKAGNEDLEAVTEVVYFDPALDAVPQPDENEDPQPDANDESTVIIIKDSKLVILIGALAGAVLLLCMILCCITVARRSRKSADPTAYEAQKPPAATSPSTQQV
jgi:hypothetical protein